MALALDGSVNATGNSISTKNLPGLTTSNANDVILLFIFSWGSSNTAFATPTDTAGLSWTQRGHWTDPISAGARYELWYGIASGALSSDVITIATSGGVSVSQLSGIAIGVSGANTSTPFDSNASLPAFGANVASVTVSTSNANDFLVALQSSGPSGPPSSTHTTWTFIGTVVGVSLNLRTDYDILSSTLSSEVISPSSGTLDIVVDAVQAAGGGGGSPLFLTTDLNGLGSGGPFFHDRLA